MLMFCHHRRLRTTGTKVTLNVKVGEDGPTLQLAVLREDRCENINLVPPVARCGAPPHNNRLTGRAV